MYSTQTTFNNKKQVDLSSFFLQTSQEGQPIYEEIPPWQSEQVSDYVDTTSGYHTLPIESDCYESERGLFLVPVTEHKMPSVVTKNFKVPSEKTNKKFITFHKSKHKSQRCLDKKDEIVNSAKKNDISTLDYSQCFNQSKKTNCIKRMVDSKTIDLHNNPRLVYKSYQSNTSRQSRPVDNKVQRHNQDNFLPRTAWTDVSGSDDWLHLQNDNTQSLMSSKTKYEDDFYRPSCPSPPDLISSKCRTTSASPSKMSTSDITVSPSSSESYPECRF